MRKRPDTRCVDSMELGGVLKLSHLRPTRVNSLFDCVMPSCRESCGKGRTETGNLQLAVSVVKRPL